MMMKRLSSCLIPMVIIGLIAPPIQSLGLFSRHTRSRDASQLACQGMVQKAGEYWYKSAGREEAGVTPRCVTYFIAPPDTTVDIEFLGFSINCMTNGHMGLLQVFDGMEIQGQTFPSFDHTLPFTERFRLYCSQKKVPTTMFTASQNVAMITSMVPTSGEGYKIRVHFRKNLQPCNVFITAGEGIYTLSNHGQHVNCTAVVSMFQPAQVTVEYVNVGATVEGVSHTKEVGLSQKCLAKKKHDYAEFLYGNTMEPSYMAHSGVICGLKTNNVGMKYYFPCQVSVVRLVSGGEFYNTITFKYGPLSQGQVEQFTAAGLTC